MRCGQCANYFLKIKRNFNWTDYFLIRLIPCTFKHHRDVTYNLAAKTSLSVTISNKEALRLGTENNKTKLKAEKYEEGCHKSSMKG